MSEKKYKDKKEYLIAGGKHWKVWNNGIVDFFYGRWGEQNSEDSWEQRLKFIKIWEEAKIGEKYDFDWNIPKLIPCFDGPVKFLGFKEEKCPKCKESDLIWNNKFQICPKCQHINVSLLSLNDIN